MPVFGKGRKGRERKEFIGKEVGFRGRILRRRQWYPFTRSSVRWIKFGFQEIFGEKDFIKERFEKTGNPVVVLDWGCGRGNAIASLAKEYGTKIKAYGFSKDSYKNWLNSWYKKWRKMDQVKFIHSTGHGLLKYLKNDSIDLIYSHMGLDKIFPSTLKSEYALEDIKEATKYIKNLLEKVSKGGKIVFDPPTKTAEEITSALEQTLEGKAEIEYDQRAIYLTKK